MKIPEQGSWLKVPLGKLNSERMVPLDDVIQMLHSDDLDVRDNAIVTLGRYPDTTELIPKVSAARGVGALTDTELSEICSRALDAPLLPDPVPPPTHLPPLPNDYPESYTDYHQRNPGFTPAHEEPDHR